MSGVQTKRIKRMQEDLLELPLAEREKMVNYLLGLEEDEGEKRKAETEICLATEFVESSQAIADNWGKVTGLKTGYPEIDTMTMGLDPGNLVLLAGRTSQYKTMLALNIVANIARQGLPVLFVTLENTKDEIVGRLRKICTNTEDFESVVANIAFQVKDELDWRSVDPLIEGFVQQFSNGGLVVIDHLHYFSRETQNTAEALGVVTKEFKKNAIRHKIPVILISHVRKPQNPSDAKKLPSIDDIRGSSLPAQDADIVLVVGASPNTKENILVEIQKNRNKGFDPDNATSFLRKDANGIRIY